MYMLRMNTTAWRQSLRTGDIVENESLEETDFSATHKGPETPPAVKQRTPCEHL